MTWLHTPENFELSSYLQGLEADRLPPNGLRGGEQYAMSNGQNIPPASSPPESPMDGSQMPPFGITCEPLTADPGPDMPMWSARDSLVNHSASLESEVPETTYETAGLTPFALLGKHNPDMSGLKTSPAYFPQIPPTANAGRIRGKNGEDSGAYQNTPTPIAAAANGRWIKPTRTLFGTTEPYSETWPRWGMMRGGVCYRLPDAALPTNANGSGSPLLYPTPTANKQTSNTASPDDLVDSRGNPWRPGKKTYDRRTGRMVTTTLHDFVRHVEMFPTPNTLDGLPPKSEEALLREATVSRVGRKKPANLRDVVASGHLWPTLTVPNGGMRADMSKVRQSGGTFYRQDGSKMQRDLETAVRQWPMESATDHKGSGANGTLRDRLDYAVERRKTKNQVYATPVSGDGNGAGRSARKRGGDSLRDQITHGNEAPTTKLNPEWVEWLMGWPIGWTSADPLPAENILGWLSTTLGDEWWLSDPHPNPPRSITHREKGRVARIKCLGNGQVPLQAAGALLLLNGQGLPFLPFANGSTESEPEDFDFGLFAMEANNE